MSWTSHGSSACWTVTTASWSACSPRRRSRSAPRRRGRPSASPLGGRPARPAPRPWGASRRGGGETSASFAAMAARSRSSSTGWPGPEPRTWGQTGCWSRSPTSATRRWRAASPWGREMKPILTPEEAGALDRASRDRGVTVETLMENAGRAVARAAVAAAGGAYGRRVVAVCGKGNNGGDGFVALRHLGRWGMGATAVVLHPRESLREPSATMLRRFEEAGGRVRDVASLRRGLARADVAIDAIFGTGFRGRPEDAAADAIRSLNMAPVPVIAVDIPSGVDGGTGAVAGAAVVATRSVTFGAAKPGLLFHPGAAHAGVIEVVDIGFPPDLVRSDLQFVEREDVAVTWPRRDPAGHKRSSG